MTASEASAPVWGPAWRVFWAHPERLLGPVLLAGAGWVLAQTLAQLLINATGATDNAAMALGTLAFTTFGLLFWAVVLRSVLGDDGHLGPQVVVTAGVLGLMITVGLAAAFLPGLVLAALGQFTMLAVVRDGRSCFTALGDSVRHVVARPAATLTFTLAALLVLSGGAALLVVGLWPATVLVAVAQVAHWNATGPDLRRVGSA